VHGRIATDWKVERSRFVLDITIPPNTAATVYLPGGGVTEVPAGRHHFEAPTAAYRRR
jgi:hypothetical protein